MYYTLRNVFEHQICNQKLSYYFENPSEFNLLLGSDFSCSK